MPLLGYLCHRPKKGVFKFVYAYANLITLSHQRQHGVNYYVAVVMRDKEQKLQQRKNMVFVCSKRRDINTLANYLV